MNTVKSEEISPYTTPQPDRYNCAPDRYNCVPEFQQPPMNNDAYITTALSIIKRRLTRTEDIQVTCPEDSKNYLVLKLSQLEHEAFSIMFLDNKHRLIKYEEMFRGTIDSSAVYPREVVKRALELNAAALIISHNHPSGSPEPSMADERITIRLKDACALVDIRVLDHIIVGGVKTVSLASRGVI